jgi:hypothetical protein
MPIARAQQTKAVFYTLIVFVGLFIIATIFAITYYVKSEDHRKKSEGLQSQLNEYASPSEQQRIGQIVGSKQPRKSRIATMNDYLDKSVTTILGGVPEETSAEVKIETVTRKTNETTNMLKAAGIGLSDPNNAGLLRTIENLKNTLDRKINAISSLNTQLQDLNNRFNDAMAANSEKEKILQDEKARLQEQANKIAADYEELKQMLEKTSEQRIQTLMAQLDQERENNKQLNQQLLKAQAEIQLSEERMQYIQKELAVLVSPDIEATARQADGRIILIDDKNKLVHLNIGRRDHVYQGLTFSVYNRNMPIPKDGKGKAEIEIVEVGQNVSTARITYSQINNPIIVDDIVANLIWDREKTNIFVMAGDFDLDGDGNIDPDAEQKIQSLIENWGGKANEDVTIETDFIILGRPTEVLRKPTFEEIEADPMAMERYEKSVQKLYRYNQIQQSAQNLSIPIFNYNRFLYFIGYKTQSEKPGAF